MLLIMVDAVRLYAASGYYIRKQDIRVYIYINLMPIAGQTAEPIVLTIFVDTNGWSGGVVG